MGSSLKELAERLGVSPSTISRAVAGKAGVSDSLRARILEVSREMQYSPSKAAQSLAGGPTRMIGLVTPFLTQSSFVRSIDAIEAALVHAGYDVLLYNVGHESQRERFFQNFSVADRTDGLILALRPSEAEAEVIRRSGLPVVLMHTAPKFFPSVDVDHYQAATTAVQYLVNLGHTKIALVGLPDRQSHYAEEFFVEGERLRAYLDVLEANGLPAPLHHRVESPVSIAGGDVATTRLFAQRELPTAVFAMSDQIAMGAIRALRRFGLRVPADVSVIGIDDHELSDFVELTTVAIPSSLQGATAAELLLAQLQHQTAAPSFTRIHTELIIRNSTARVAEPTSTTPRITDTPIT